MKSSYFFVEVRFLVFFTFAVSSLASASAFAANSRASLTICSDFAALLRNTKAPAIKPATKIINVIRISIRQLFNQKYDHVQQ